MNREIAMADLAEAIERRLGAVAATPYWHAYKRIIYTDYAPISDAQIDRLLAKGRSRLLSRRSA